MKELLDENIKTLDKFYEDANKNDKKILKSFNPYNPYSNQIIPPPPYYYPPQECMRCKQYENIQQELTSINIFYIRSNK